ncbi:MAG: glutamine--fructose-6-phosphate transaminase (isomerizing) [Candidatus Babeliales bacterium]|jgi:glucosamine--fructose-6-phosphate aminotransferase (isomerizing)
MCGIVAYNGNKSCRQLVLEGLTRLERYEYDSAGFVCIDSRHAHFSYHKEAGGVSPIQRLGQEVNFDGTIGIAHLRWTAHGVADANNAQPHFNCKKNITGALNGTIEGGDALRHRLVDQGHELITTTDAEAVIHLFGILLEQLGDHKKALIELFKQTTGAYALVVLDEAHPEKLMVTRRHSPLSIGVGEGEMIVVSDVASLPPEINRVIFIPDNACACIYKDSLDLYNAEGRPIPYYIQEIDSHDAALTRMGKGHHLPKEIFEQKRAIHRTIAFCKSIGPCLDDQIAQTLMLHRHHHASDYDESLWRHMGLTTEKIQALTSINLIGAGSSWHAAQIAAFFFREIVNIRTHVHMASEFCATSFFPEQDSLYFIVSESGETKDTLAALRLANSYDQHTVAITNVASSTMVREASGFLPLQAGPEIAHTSTKAFSTQVATLYWLAHRIALDRGKIDAHTLHEIEETLFVAAEILEAVIDSNKFPIIQEFIPRYCTWDRFVLLGRHINYPFALEAALKFREIAKVYAIGLPVGEIEHESYALIAHKVPTFLFSVLDDVGYQRILGMAQAIKENGGNLIVIAFEEQNELIRMADFSFVIPRVTPLLAPLAMTGLMQFLAFQLSHAKEHPYFIRPHHAHQPPIG